MSFWTVFFPLPALRTQKIKILKNFFKKPEDIIISQMCTINDSRCMVPEMWSATDRIFCHFEPLFALLLPPNTLKNQNFEKIKKPPRNIIILLICTINDNHISPFTPLTTQKIKILKK